ncbi:stage IV sporulation protein FB [Salibacterium salarium]|uniref:Stage IV sporulation protein FB n=1 Tax=Salibacterium salarium TaxID=284579 RepID=A0A3R9P742_9BACI|nr:M50 family metallopeptidase [Salibacterium salarium]RSL32698.1 stage IV sporulation protein FB [Salibacterium salarium]
MIKQLSLVRFHPLFWVMAGAAVFTGFFYDILLLFLIIFLHELGHAFAALHFSWRIKKIELLPFGGMMETEEHGNRPIIEEVIVAIAGPFVHLPLIALSFLLLPASFWHVSDHTLFIYYNLTLLCFNMLPVWPLDGGKLLFCWYTSRLPYYWAQKKMWWTSCFILSGLTIILFLCYPLHLQAWCLLLFFIVIHYTEWRQQPYSFFRFLMEKATMDDQASSKAFINKQMSWHNRPVDAAKYIGKNKVTSFFIIENGQTLPESYILEAIVKKRRGLVTFIDLLSE